MPRMLGNLSIRSKLLALLAVPVAGTALLGVTGLAAAAERLDRLPVVRAGVDGRLVPPGRVVDDHGALVAALLGASHGLAGWRPQARPGRPACPGQPGACATGTSPDPPRKLYH